ncbi:MAG: phosphate ABC transporter substrate-binding protein PstS [Casimicrobium sp.]
MHRLGLFLLSLTACAASSVVAQTTITGAGATFPYPIYAKWADEYRKATGVAMNYQSIGSGGGIKQIQAKTVDFGATDMPMKPENLAKDDLVQFPAIIGSVVPVVNVKGVAPGELKLTGALLADIYLGKIKQWSDPAIAALNPNLKLEGTIIVIRRSDGSGTTFLFTNYLSKISAEWKEKVGAGSAVSWPTGLGGKGNEGVAQYVQRVKGSIGYVEFAFAKKTKLAFTQLKNKDGQFVAPSDESISAAALNANWTTTPGMGVILTDQVGAKSWPMTGASFILMHAKQTKPDTAREVLKFFDWSMKNGADAASKLGYVPLPAATVALVQNEWKKIGDASGKALR